MAKNKCIVDEIYDAWRAQDLAWLASYLPDDFCHAIHIPADVHPLGGVARGKSASIERLGVIADDFDIVQFDTSGLITQNDVVAVEIPFHYRHRETGTGLETTSANFWTLEDGWPVRLSEYHDLGRILEFHQTVLEATGSRPR